MERPFSEQEVIDGLKGMKVDSVPGLDEFSAKFYLEFWDTIGDDVMCVMNEFHASGSLCRSLNSSFITLIPKSRDPLEIRDYRPISLLNSLYKHLVKVLATRMELIMGNVFQTRRLRLSEGAKC